tara:strand:+ start:465 stop:845 length:381 start_codon:yes stop_codon:yes gene_type:complete
MSNETKVNTENLEFHDGGDGWSYEVWRDTTTDKLYHVPIEIQRYYEDMEEVESCFEAKFGPHQKDYIDEGHVDGEKRYTQAEAIEVIRKLVKEDDMFKEIPSEDWSGSELIEMGAKWYHIYYKGLN